MKFACYNVNSGYLLHKYSDDVDVCEKCLDFSGDLRGGGLCKKNKYYLTKKDENSDLCYFFCLDNCRTAKHARLYTRIVIDAFKKSIAIEKNKILEIDKSKGIAVHNTRNIVAEINSSLLNFFGEDSLSNAKDKIGFIENKLSTNLNYFSNKILSVIKSLSQAMKEYNIIDFLDPSVRLSPSDFVSHGVHKILVQSFYTYQEEFKSKAIYVNLKDSNGSCYVNFNTIKTALGQLLENCMKYCKPDSEINVKFRDHDKDYISVSFKMTSLYFKNSNIKRLLEYDERGEYAELIGDDGKGYGLPIILRMLDLNRGRFEMKSNEHSLFYLQNIPYASNEFTFYLLKDRTAYYRTLS